MPENKNPIEECRNCYTCEQGVDKSVTVDDLRGQRMVKCQNCYTCETGVDKSITVDDLKEKEASIQPTGVADCVNCYTCESCVTSEQSRKGGEDLTSRCKNCYACESCIAAEAGEQPQKVDTPSCANCYTCEWCISSEAGQGGQGKGMSAREKAAKCENCYTCEQGVDKSQSVDMLRRNPYSQQFTFFLFPTNGCNLVCKYCYANNKPGKMTTETMHDTLNFLFKIQPYENITCHFFGGEPMVMYDMLQDIVTIGNQMAKDTNRKVTWSMTTNGTLFTPERLDWVKDNFRKNNPFLLSIDGRPETHDKYRVFVGDKPSHAKIPVDLILEMFPHLECRPTISPDTAKDWFEDFKWLRDKGFKAVAIEPNFECEWTQEQKHDYENMLWQVGQYYIIAQKVEKPFRVKFIDQTMQGLNNNEMPGGNMCGTANNCAGIDHRGKLYACQRFASYNDPDKYAIGDVVNGFSEYEWFKTRILPRDKVRGDVSAGYDCETCWVRRFCMKGCNAANMKWMGSRDIAVPMYCELTRIETRVALMVLTEMNKLGLKDATQSAGCACKI